MKEKFAEIGAQAQVVRGEILSSFPKAAMLGPLITILAYMIAAWYVNRGDAQWPEFAISF
jgi:hypothetical protein